MCEILVPLPGREPLPPVLEAVLTSRPPGKRLSKAVSDSHTDAGLLIFPYNMHLTVSPFLGYHLGPIYITVIFIIVVLFYLFVYV